MANILKRGSTQQSKETRWWYYFGWNCHNCQAEWEAEAKDKIVYDQAGYNESYATVAEMQCPWCGVKTHHPATTKGKKEREGLTFS